MIEYIQKGNGYDELKDNASKRQSIIKAQSNSLCRLSGKVQNKFTGHNSLIEKRPHKSIRDLGMEYFVDLAGFDDKMIVLRGWMFQKDSQSFALRIHDTNNKSIPFRMITELRDDVADVFKRSTDDILGFCILVEKKYFEVLSPEIEIDTLDGYTVIPFEIKDGISIKDQTVLYFLYAVESQADQAELARQRKTKFAYNPLISVVVPLYNTPLDFLEEMIRSIVGQTYSNVQLCLADGSTDPSVGEYINKKYGKNKKVVYKHLEHNGGISDNTNEAIAMATGDFIMLGDHDDVVMPNACFEMVKALNDDPEIDVVYTDEDKVTMDGDCYFDPHFKPDFDLTFLRTNNYICHIFMVRKSIVDGFEVPERKEYDGAQDFDFILRCCEKARKVYHVPKVLYHWRCHPLSTAGNPASKMYAYEAGMNSVKASYERLGINAEVEMTKAFGRYKSTYIPDCDTSISVVFVDTQSYEDRFDKWKAYLDSKLENIAHKLIKVTANLDDIKGDDLVGADYFNSLSSVISEIDTEYVVFIDDRMQVPNDNWILDLLGLCQLEDNAICGSKLMYNDGCICSAGKILGMHGLVGDELRGWKDSYCSNYGRGEANREVSAVSVLGMITRASVLSQHEFDNKCGRFTDIDLCLNAMGDGHKVIYSNDTPITLDLENPYACKAGVDYLNSEHKSTDLRGSVNDLFMVKRAFEDYFGGTNGLDCSDAAAVYFRDKWSDVLSQGDNHHNPNLSLVYSDGVIKTY